MAKITRAELARRKRVELYKKIIVYGFMVLTILPIFSSVFLFYKVADLEKKLDYAIGLDGGDYLTYRSSKEALLSNPKIESSEFDADTKTSLAISNVNTGRSDNMEDDSNPDTGAIEEPADGTIPSPDDVEEKKRVYLTFDDGPSIYTGQILDILAANDVKATFFVIGRDENYYEYYKRIVEEGHTIGMHSYSHVYQDFYASREAFAKELEDLNNLIFEVTGTRSSVFRFPGGSSNQVCPLPIQDYISYLNENGIYYYDWNALSGDAVTSGLSPEQLVQNIMNDVEKNEDSIVLMHDLQTTHATVESLQLLIDTLKSQGYEILPIDNDTPLIQHVSYDTAE